MNSAHETVSMNSNPNSDCKQFTESKLGWVHSAHTQNPGRAHYTRSAQVVGAAARTTNRSWVHARLVARAAVPAALAPVATQSPGCDTQFKQARLRPKIDVVTSLCSSHRNVPIVTQNIGRDTKPPQGSKNHVVTSNRCRDTTKATPGRDLKTGSRHRFSFPTPN